MVRKKSELFLAATAVIVGSLLYFYFDPSVTVLFPPCPFYALTGLYCPGCGSQRAMHDLLQGNIGLACGHNVLFVALIPVILFSAVVVSMNVYRKEKITPALFHSAWFTKVVLAAILIFWIVRNIPAEPFAVFAPSA